MDDFPLLHAANALERVVDKSSGRRVSIRRRSRRRRRRPGDSQRSPERLPERHLAGSFPHRCSPTSHRCWTSAFVLDIVGGKKSRRPPAPGRTRRAQRAATAASGAPTGPIPRGSAARRSRHQRRTPLAVAVLRVVVESASHNRHARGVALGFPEPPRRRRRLLGGHCSHGEAAASTTPPFTPARPNGPDDRVSERLDRCAPRRGRRRAGAPVLETTASSQLRDLSASRRAAPKKARSTRTPSRAPGTEVAFALADGALLRGPSAMPLPRYETRVNDGTVEVRALAG